MKKSDIAKFKAKLQKVEHLIIDCPSTDLFVCDLQIKSLHFIFRVSRFPLREFGCLNYLLIIKQDSFVFTDGSGIPVPLECLRFSLSKLQFISAFCFLYKFAKVLKNED